MTRTQSPSPFTHHVYKKVHNHVHTTTSIPKRPVRDDAVGFEMCGERGCGCDITD